MTIYSYFRTSELEATLEKDQLDAILESEALSIQTYCLGRRWFLTETLRDSNCSWNLEFHKRENGKKLIDMLQPGDVVLCSKLERIVSSSQEAVKLIRDFKEKSTQLHVIELGHDITSSESNVNFEMIAEVFSSLETCSSALCIRCV